MIVKAKKTANIIFSVRLSLVFVLSRKCQKLQKIDENSQYSLNFDKENLHIF